MAIMRVIDVSIARFISIAVVAVLDTFCSTVGFMMILFLAIVDVTVAPMKPFWRLPFCLLNN